MQTKKRKVGEARESCANLLDFHDVVDDRGEKNPCTDSSYLHVSPTNAISTASNVSTAAPPLACTTPLTSPVASTSANISCTMLISETPLSAVTSSLMPSYNWFSSQKADGNSHPSSSQFTSRRPRKSKRPSHGQKKKEVNKVTHSFFSLY